MGYRVLLMDDEKAICEITGIILKKLGYDPVVTSTGLEALLEFNKAIDRGTPFDVVILDLAVPGGMGGKETIDKLKKLDPNVKALVSSGNLSDPAVISYADYGFSGVLIKPYNKADIDNAIKNVMKQEL
jgi:DNA-binding NtrC family response regulator